MNWYFRATGFMLPTKEVHDPPTVTKFAQTPLLSRNAHDNEIMRLRVYDTYNFFLLE